MTMSCGVDWVFPVLRKPKFKLWNFASSLTLAAVGLFSKLLIVWFNKTKIHNENNLHSALDNRPQQVPLLTVSNHHSCFDDPGLWGVLKLKHLLNYKKMRWSMAAHDICFTNIFHSYFFMLGKCVPVIRGNGVYQAAVDFCIERLSKGQWVHIFPEGKVNMTKEFLRFKWGVGRLVYESPVLPIIIPIWHVGMDQVLPNYPPYILKTRKKVTYNFGKPIDLKSIVENLKNKNASEEEARKCITDVIQDELMKLKSETEKLHDEYLSKGS